MKKLIIVLTTAALMFTVAGCSSEKSTADANKPATQQATTNTTQETSKDTTDKATQDTAKAAAPEYKDGTYTAMATGKGGDVKVEVKVADGKITEVNVLDNNETPAMLDSVKAGLIPKIIEQQTTEGLDTVSGATLSSNAVLKAVGQVMTEATK